MTLRVMIRNYITALHSVFHFCIMRLWQLYTILYQNYFAKVSFFIALLVPFAERWIITMKIPMKVEFPMPEDIRDLYTEDEHEFLIAVSDGYYGGDVYSDESLHEAQFEILGKIDLTTGKKIKGRGSASWIAAKYPNTVEYNNYFDKVNDSVKEIVHPKTIYRVKGYAPIDPVNKPLYFFLERHMNGLISREIRHTSGLMILPRSRWVT